MLFLSSYFQQTRIHGYATNITLMIDEGKKFTKGLLIFEATEKRMPVDLSVLVWISTAKKSQRVAECFRSFRVKEILPFLRL